MSSLDELIERARALLSEGHSPGQIADELSLSIETVTWLLTQQKSGAIPKDVGIDWTAVSSEGPLLDELAMMMLKHFYSAISDEAREKNSRNVPFSQVDCNIRDSACDPDRIRGYGSQSIIRQSRSTP